MKMICAANPRLGIIHFQNCNFEVQNCQFQRPESLVDIIDIIQNTLNKTLQHARISILYMKIHAMEQ